MAMAIAVETKDCTALSDAELIFWVATLTLAYTYAHSRDDWSSDLQSPSLVNLGASPAPGFQGGQPGDWVRRPIDVDWGPSDFDVPHTFVTSHVWQLPDLGRPRLLGGFTLAGMLVARSGHPFTTLSGQDFEDVGFSGSARPALSRAISRCTRLSST